MKIMLNYSIDGIYYEYADVFEHDKVNLIEHFPIQIALNKTQNVNNYMCISYHVTVYIKQAVQDMTIHISMEQKIWSKENYVFAPAAAYNGNRFKSIPLKYPPISIGAVDDVPNPKIIITDVPRLSDTISKSKIELMVGDLSQPLFGFFSAKMQKAYFISFSQQYIPNMDNSICISEDLENKTADFSIVIPAKRDKAYRHMCSSVPSNDVGANLNANDTINIFFEVYDIPCKNITAFFEFFSNIRSDCSFSTIFENKVPFYKTFKSIESKYNIYNWASDYKFYRSSIAENNVCSEWQTGWVGGGMSTYPCLLAGNDLSKKRTIKTLEFVFDKILIENGFMYGMFYHGKPYGDDINVDGNANHLLTRKFTDAVYFLIKHFIVFKDQCKSFPKKWENGIRNSLNVLCQLFEENGQFGQFVDISNKKILVRGTSSAATGIAALALGYQYYNDLRYLNIAKEAGYYYFDNYVSQGISNGGPGEICQCPDSESIFGLLESYIALYDVTGDDFWIAYAKASANIASSWCVAYDFVSPKNSQFYRRNVHSTGAVWANIQNKHAAPGICTLSGVSLLKLYRATKEEKYLTLFKQISHNITQFVSVDEDPFYFSYGGKPTAHYNPEGFSGERINLSDWEGTENIGEFPNGSCWCEVTMLLNYVENPGVYIVKDLNLIYTFDHIDYKILVANADNLRIELINNTIYDAVVCVFEETSA